MDRDQPLTRDELIKRVDEYIKDQVKTRNITDQIKIVSSTEMAPDQGYSWTVTIEVPPHLAYLFKPQEETKMNQDQNKPTYGQGFAEGFAVGKNKGLALANVMKLVAEYNAEKAITGAAVLVERYSVDGMVPVNVLNELVRAMADLGFTTGAAVMFQHERADVTHIDDMKKYVDSKYTS